MQAERASKNLNRIREEDQVKDELREPKYKRAKSEQKYTKKEANINQAKNCLSISALALLLGAAAYSESYASTLSSGTGKPKGCHVFGKIRFVEYGEDYKIKFVNYGENLRVKYVNYGESQVGNWKTVNYGEDFKLKIVKYGEDFTVKTVSYGEGCN
jgi:hypothetical protein